MYKAIVSLENEVDRLKQITTINKANSDLNNYYTKSEIDDKLDDISGANLSNYVQFGENSTDEGVILMGKTQNQFKTTLNQQSLEITDGSLISEITDSRITFTNKNSHNFRIALDTVNDEADLVIGDKMNISVGSSTLAITQDDVTFKGQSLLGGGSSPSGNYIINGENNGNVNIATNNSGSINVTSGNGGINISGGGGSVNIASVSSNGINITSQGSTLAITQDDVTFKGNSLLSGGSVNYVVNGENNNGVNITTDNTNNISLSAEGTGEINLSSKHRINLDVNTARFVVTPDDVTFNHSSFIVNGTNNKNINIKTGDGNSITIEDGNDNIIDFASMHGIKLTSGGSTLNITDSDVVFKGQSLIVDTSNFIINGANNKAININNTTDPINFSVGKGQSLINSGGGGSGGNYVVNGENSSDVNISTGSAHNVYFTVGGNTLAILKSDVTFRGQSLIVDTSNFIVNGINSYPLDITTNNVNITANSGVMGQSINLTAGASTLAISQDDITFKGQSLIVDTSNFVINGANSGDVNINISNGSDLNITTGSGAVNISSDDNVNISVVSSTLAITSTDVTFKGNSLIVVINGDNGNNVNINVSNNIYLKTSEYNNGEIRLEFPQYSTMDVGGYISISRYSLNFLERGNNINFIMTSNTRAQKFIVCVGSDTPNEANSFIINESDVKFKNTSLVNPSTTITHKAPIDESLTQEDFEIGKPVYMTGKVYVKESSETGWKRSDSIDDAIDCISSVKHTGTWREYLGICVGKYKTRVGLEENEINFASHGDFMVKYSKCNVGDTLYVTDDGNINVLNDETLLTLKIQRQIIGLVTEKINDEYCAVFKSN